MWYENTWQHTQGMIHSAEIDLNRFCDLIGGYLYLANQVREIGFDFAKSITALVAAK
jgi:hypothetical protein